jgi:hypothetical protein
VGLVLDIAAGILLALVIAGMVPYGDHVAATAIKENNDAGAYAGLFIWALGIALGIGLVVCRLLRWP